MCTNHRTTPGRSEPLTADEYFQPLRDIGVAERRAPDYKKGRIREQHQRCLLYTASREWDGDNNIIVTDFSTWLCKTFNYKTNGQKDIGVIIERLLQSSELDISGGNKSLSDAVNLNRLWIDK